MSMNRTVGLKKEGRNGQNSGRNEYQSDQSRLSNC